MGTRGREKSKAWTVLGPVLGLVVAIAAVLAPAATGAPGVWLPPPTSISGMGEGSVPRIDAGADGTAVAVWSEQTGEKGRVQARIRGAGNFGPIIPLSDGTRNATFPEIAVGAGGHIAAAWEEEHGADDWRVHASIGTLSGGFGPPVELSERDHDGPVVAPQVAVAPDGTVAVTWFRSEGGTQCQMEPGTICVVEASVSPSGGSFGEPLALAPAGTDAIAPEPAFDKSGKLVIAWMRSNGADVVIEAKVRPAGGEFPAGVPIGLTTASSSVFPQVSVSPDDTFNFTWMRNTDSVGEFLVQTRSLDSDGQLTPPVAVSNDGGDSEGNAWDAQIATGSDGTTAIVWQRTLEPGKHVIQGRIRPANGSFGPIFDLSARGVQVETPQVEVGPDGTVTAVWPQVGEDGPAVLARTLYPSGVSTIPVALSTTDVPGLEPAIGIDTMGETSVVWTGQRESGDTIEFVSTWVKRPDDDDDDDDDPKVCPRHRLNFGKLVRNRKKGIATLVVRSARAGNVVLRGSRTVKGRKAKIGGGGKARIRIQVRGKAAKNLRKRGNVKLKLRFVFRPQDGCSPVSRSRTVKLVKRR